MWTIIHRKLIIDGGWVPSVMLHSHLLSQSLFNSFISTSLHSFLFLFILLLHCPYFKAGWGYATDFGGTDEAYKAEKGISSFVRRRRLTRKQIFYRTFLYNLVCYNYPVPSHVLILLTRSGFLYLHLVIFFALKNAL